MATKVYEVSELGQYDKKAVVAMSIDEYEYMISLIKLFDNFGVVEVKRQDITNVVAKRLGTYYEDWVLVQ